jgi:hypothetical protein
LIVPEADPATGRPEAAVSGDHMLRWPFRLRSRDRPVFSVASFDHGVVVGGDVLS